MNIKMLFEKSMWKMLEKKSIKNITLNMLIEDVGSCKGTFYKYFMDKYDLCNVCLVNNVYSQLDRIDDFEAYCTDCFAIFDKNSAVLRHAFDSDEVDSARRLHESKTVEALARRAADDADDVRDECIKRYAAICTDIFVEWLNGCGTSVSECTDRLRALTPQYIYGSVYGGDARRGDLDLETAGYSERKI